MFSKKLSAAEASESVYMREKVDISILFFDKICSKSSAAELSYEGNWVKEKWSQGVVLPMQATQNELVISVQKI